jgi:sulfate adenylyltransferase subunit 1
MLCITDNGSLHVGSRFLLQHNSAVVKAVIKDIFYKLDINSNTRIDRPTQLAPNDLVHVRLKTAIPLAFDPYQSNRQTGAFILINENTFHTAAAGMIKAIEPDYVI